MDHTEELQWAYAALEVARIALEKSLQGDPSDNEQAMLVVDAVLETKSVTSVSSAIMHAMNAES